MPTQLHYEVFDYALSCPERKEYQHLINGDPKRWNERMDASIVSIACFDDKNPIAFSFGTQSIIAPIQQINRPVELGGMNVMEQYRRQGIRSAMVDMRVDYIQKNQYSPISVTLTDNFSSNKYFETHPYWSKEVEFVHNNSPKYLWKFAS